MLVKHNDSQFVHFSCLGLKTNSDLPTHLFFQTCYSKHNFFWPQLNCTFFGCDQLNFNKMLQNSLDLEFYNKIHYKVKYCKTPKFSDTQEIAVIILKFE